jgi:Rod binding domain-containing protein
MKISNSPPSNPNTSPNPIESHREKLRKTADPDIRQAAEGLEQMYLDVMMRAMRETLGEDPSGLDSQATKIYQSMLDSELTASAAKKGGFGLSEQIIEHLMAQRYTHQQGLKAEPRNLEVRRDESKAPQPLSLKKSGDTTNEN